MIITAVTGSPTLFTALKDSLTLVKSAQANFATVQLVKAGDILGRYQLSQGKSVAAVADKDLKFTGWKGSPTSAQMSLRSVKSENLSLSSQTVGDVTIPKSIFTDQKSIDVKLNSVLPQPSNLWRLSHPFN